MKSSLTYGIAGSLPRLWQGSVKVAAGALCAGLFMLAPAAQAQEQGGPVQMQKWDTCLEAVVQLQQEMSQTLPAPAQPPSADQSIAAQDSAQPTEGSLAAAGLDQPSSGAWGALNEAMNLQAAGNEAGCFKAVQKARELAGL
ncbi:hypothetical protein ACT6QG_12235 [Xanthobacter sp. TB0136]|uniref:hypothetical protein n=1 Tax=Xanthobacter sp. TB0136 TaxID=3459177 RepID=UPI004039DB78